MQQQQFMQAQQLQALGAAAPEVEQFILGNDLDEKAANALRSAGPHLQRYVLDLGGLEGCRSKSAGCLGRLTKAQSGAVQLGQATPAALGGDGAAMAGPEEVESFILQNQLQ